jgi:hypothetical protein
MRSYKLTSAILATAALLALATAGAAAARTRTIHHGHRTAATAGPCRVGLNVAPRLITSGESTLAYGRTNCGSGQTVTLYQRSAGSSGFSVAGTGSTGLTGAYQIPTAALEQNTAFYALIGASRSLERRVNVAAQVVLAGPPESKTDSAGLFTGRRNAVTFSGTVSPDDAGAIVWLERENAIRGNEWGVIGRTLVTSTGTFAITHAFAAPGASDVRVLVRSNHRNIASPSNVLSYEISQAENPALTIYTALDPIAFGGTTSINGVAASLPNTTVTLLSRTAHSKFAKITTAPTNGEGAYTFTNLAPTASTFYEVQAGGKTSAVLYQGVKYVLTAAPSTETLQSGEPLTFTGIVTPAVVGHVIYIEREDVNGAGYHVVAVGTVGPGGAYSISHTFYAPGTINVRVKIPGDPENGGTASQTWSIPVNPIPSPASLGPESPSNSSQPST